MKVRTAVLQEIPVLNEVDDDASWLFGTEPAFAFVMDYPGRTDDQYAEFVASGGALVAEADGDLAGFVLMGVVDDAAHVFQVSVRKAFQRQGIGRALIEEGCRWGLDRGYRNASLTTFRDLAWNGPAYERMGFRIAGAEELGPGLADILDEERRIGLWRSPRVAMIRMLAG